MFQLDSRLFFNHLKSIIMQINFKKQTDGKWKAFYNDFVGIGSTQIEAFKAVHRKIKGRQDKIMVQLNK